MFIAIFVVVITGGVVSAGGAGGSPVELFCASAAGAINGIDGGTNSMLTRKIPKKIVKLFFSVTLYLITQRFMSDRGTSANFESFTILTNC